MRRARYTAIFEPVRARWIGPTVSVSCAVLVLAACGCEPAEPATTPAIEPPPARRGGVIEGVVRLAEGAELVRLPDNPVQPSGRPPLPDVCAPPREQDREPVRRDAEGRLSNVLIAVTEFGDAPPHEPATHTITIRDCRIDPPIIAATQGDHLVLRNETDYPFLPALGEGITRALLRGQTRDLELPRGGVQRMECTFAAACGVGWVVTLYHPLHTVTDEHGHFRIEGVPAGRRVRVSAWHPLYREAFSEVEVSADHPVSVELAIAPGDPLPAPPPPPSTGPVEDHPDPNAPF